MSCHIIDTWLFAFVILLSSFSPVQEPLKLLDERRERRAGARLSTRHAIVTHTLDKGSS